MDEVALLDPSLRELGGALASPWGPSKAREFADQCLDLATRTNSRKYLVKGYRLMGEIALARRQWDEAEGHSSRL